MSQSVLFSYPAKTALNPRHLPNLFFSRHLLFPWKCPKPHRFANSRCFKTLLRRCGVPREAPPGASGNSPGREPGEPNATLSFLSSSYLEPPTRANETRGSEPNRPLRGLGRKKETAAWLAPRFHGLAPEAITKRPLRGLVTESPVPTTSSIQNPKPKIQNRAPRPRVTSRPRSAPTALSRGAR